MSILIAEDLKKSYSKRKVLDGVSMHIEQGEVVGLLGPNGAGKTTCFYIIVGLVVPDGGRVLLDEHNITSDPMHVRARHGVGYLPQEASVFRKLTVEENIVSILQYRPDLRKRDYREEVENLLGELQITHIRDSLGMSLSGGERRRVEIARALAADPVFILLDEPFAGVDPISVIDIQRIIRHLQQRNIGVLITDHSVRETLGICERAYILSDGNLIAEGTADDILQNQQVKEVYLGESFTL